MRDVMRFVPKDVQRLLEECDEATRQGVVAAYRECADNRGGYRMVSQAPTPGSHRYPWRRRPRPTGVGLTA